MNQEFNPRLLWDCAESYLSQTLTDIKGPGGVVFWVCCDISGWLSGGVVRGVVATFWGWRTSFRGPPSLVAICQARSWSSGNGIRSSPEHGDIQKKGQPGCCLAECSRYPSCSNHAAAFWRKEDNLRHGCEACPVILRLLPVSWKINDDRAKLNVGLPPRLTSCRIISSKSVCSTNKISTKKVCLVKKHYLRPIWSILYPIWSIVGPI